MVVRELNYFFDKSDKCICCGCIKQKNSINYCEVCLKQIKKFVNNIVGNINIGNDDSIKNKLLSPLENFRSGMISEQINRMVDNYFLSHINTKEFSELYNENMVVADAYKEKMLIMEMVIDLVPFTYETCNTHHNKYLKYYAEYMDKLEQMNIKDEEILKELTLTTIGYSYSKK